MEVYCDTAEPFISLSSPYYFKLFLIRVGVRGTHDSCARRGVCVFRRFLFFFFFCFFTSFRSFLFSVFTFRLAAQHPSTKLYTFNTYETSWSSVIAAPTDRSLTLSYAPGNSYIDSLFFRMRVRNFVLRSPDDSTILVPVLHTGLLLCVRVLCRNRYDVWINSSITSADILFLNCEQYTIIYNG